MLQQRIEFLFVLIKRKIVEKYIGSAFIILWIIMNPLIPLLTNLLIFSFISKIPQVTAMGTLNYAIYIFSGLLPYRLLQKTAGDGTELILSNMDILKNVSFPLPFLSMTAIGTALFEFSLQFLLLVAMLLFSGQFFSSNLIFLPIALALLSFLSVGLSWFLSVVGVIFKDIQEIVNVTFVSMIYFTPIMYPEHMFHRGLMQNVINFNPVSHLVIVFRDILLPTSTSLHLMSWLYFATTAFVIFAIGFSAIYKTRRFVADLV